MGIGIGSRCSSSPYSVPNSNPDPSRFTILDWAVSGSILVVKVKYPDAKNYEGIKIMVYKGFHDTEALRRAVSNRLDPHFSQSGVSPIARFEPTDEGWGNALQFAQAMSKRHGL
jgi:hypothetical protein